jgi:hypothetical protein
VGAAGSTMIVEPKGVLDGLLKNWLARRARLSSWFMIV